MNVREARKILEDALRGRADAEEQWVDARSRMDGMHQVALGVLKAFPQLIETLDDCELVILHQVAVERPKGSEAVRNILTSQPNQAFSVNEMVQALNIRGWLPESDNPQNAVRVALERVIAGDDNAFFKTPGDENNPVRYYFQDPRLHQVMEEMALVTQRRLKGSLNLPPERGAPG